MGIKMLHKDLHKPLYNIYGFVRLADEIVDSFDVFDKKSLLSELKKNTFLAIKNKISLNPILNSFQDVVNKYDIDHNLIKTFLSSMEMDLYHKKFNEEQIKNYILGSAEVVGLMCLTVFVNGEKEEYNKLKPFAMHLGSAFQKINFLRDINSDHKKLGRTYFPGINIDKFNESDKIIIEKDIEKEFMTGKKGIKMLPRSSKSGVYLSYLYFYSLFLKIKKIPANQLLKTRIRIPNYYKFLLLLKSLFILSLKKI
tara:strand:- start:37 stop:798 length:762 start_codon:yes stop_codon:yes gene_type:complete